MKPSISKPMPRNPLVLIVSLMALLMLVISGLNLTFTSVQATTPSETATTESVEPKATETAEPSSAASLSSLMAVTSLPPPFTRR